MQVRADVIELIHIIYQNIQHFFEKVTLERNLTQLPEKSTELRSKIL